RLEQMAERNPRRARCLARPAAEAEIEMTDERLARGDAPFGRCAHQVETSARRIHLLSEREIGRTLGETDSAVDALPEVVERDGVVRGGAGDPSVGHRPPTKRPGFSTRCGSNSFLSARITASAPGSAGPHGSIASRSARGPFVIIA